MWSNSFSFPIYLWHHSPFSFFFFPLFFSTIPKKNIEIFIFSSIHFTLKTSFFIYNKLWIFNLLRVIFIVSKKFNFFSGLLKMNWKKVIEIQLKGLLITVICWFWFFFLFFWKHLNIKKKKTFLNFKTQKYFNKIKKQFYLFDLKPQTIPFIWFQLYSTDLILFSIFP